MFQLKKRGLKISIMFLIIGGIIYFLFKIKIILTPFIFGIILAYLFNPFIRFMMKRDFSRQGALLILLILVFNIFFISGLFLFPVFFRELESLAEIIPGTIKKMDDIIIHMNREYEQIDLPPVVKNSLDGVLLKVENYFLSMIKRITEVLLNSISCVLSLLVAPIITYYLLKDIEVFKRKFVRILPGDKKRFIYKIVMGINKIFIGYFRGQIWISIIVGIMGTIGLYLLQVRFFLILGILAGITNMIPYIGPIVGSIPAVVLALLSSPLHALAVILLYTFIQQIESSIIAPKIMSEKVGLHPLTVIFSLLAGAELFGIWGLLFAIPVAGSLKVVISLGYEHYYPGDN